MSDYIIFTDSACDIKPEMLKEWGVPYKSLTFRFSDSDTEYSNEEMPVEEFYNKMRGGSVAKTAAANVEIFIGAFDECLAQDKDILYLGFSSGLSTTYNSARLAAEQLRAKYPDRKIITVDTLAASAGQGMLVRLALDKQASGATIEECAAYIDDVKFKLCHWFTVDDLVYLKRGGRISATSAFFGNALGIKPVMHVDNDGHLVPVAKVRGRKTSLSSMVEKYGELAEDPANGIVYISHGDCIDDAQSLADMLKSKYGATVDIITYVGTVIGAHSGPGTLALFFVGKER